MTEKSNKASETYRLSCAALKEEDKKQPDGKIKFVTNFLDNFKKRILGEEVDAQNGISPEKLPTDNEDLLRRHLPIVNSIQQFNPQSTDTLRQCAAKAADKDKNWYLALANMIEQDFLAFAVQQDRFYEAEQNTSAQINVDETENMARESHNLAMVQIELLDALAEAIKDYDNKKHPGICGMGLWIAEAREYSNKFVSRIPRMERDMRNRETEDEESMEQSLA